MQHDVKVVLIDNLMTAMYIDDVRGSDKYDIQGKFVCSGVFALISSQTIVNIGMVLGFIPVIGITLPLFSAGGTSALSTLICLGLVQSVRQHNIDDINTAKIRRGSESRIRL